MITLAYFGLAILIGFTLGNYLQAPALAMITLLVMATVAYFQMRAREKLERAIQMIFIVPAGVAVAAMWVTYYITTQQSWVGEFLRAYILR